MPGRTSAIGEAAGGGTDIGTDQTRRIQRKARDGSLELVTAAGDKSSTRSPSILG